MSDMLTLALIVLITSIVVFFSKEFSDAIKKVLAIWGMSLLLPLALATFITVYYEDTVSWALTSLQANLALVIEKLAAWLPFKRLADFMANIIVLIAFPFLPVLAIKARYKKKPLYAFKYDSITIAILWLFIVLLIVTDYDY